MPGFGNNYYTVEQPFRILKKEGFSPSNTYIGSSRASDAVLKAETAYEGDEIHDLVGGMFHVCERTGRTTKVRLVPSKGLLEKSYGADPEGSRRDALVKGEFLSPTEEPKLEGNYRQATEISDAQHPEFTGGIYAVDRDPLEDIADNIIDDMQDAGIDIEAASCEFRSQTAYDNAKFTFNLNGHDDQWVLYVLDDGRVRLSAPKALREHNNSWKDAKFVGFSSATIAATLSDWMKEKLPAAPTP